MPSTASRSGVFGVSWKSGPDQPTGRLPVAFSTAAIESRIYCRSSSSDMPMWMMRRRIIHIGMSEDEERQYIRDSIAAVEKATGKRPVGWSGPDFQETPNTPDLLAAEGIRYVCDWGNDEQPYKMTPKKIGR